MLQQFDTYFRPGQSWSSGMVKGFDLWTVQLLLQVSRYASENEHVVIYFEKHNEMFNTFLWER